MAKQLIKQFPKVKELLDEIEASKSSADYQEYHRLRAKTLQLSPDEQNAFAQLEWLTQEINLHLYGTSISPHQEKEDKYNDEEIASLYKQNERLRNKISKLLNEYPNLLGFRSEMTRNRGSAWRETLTLSQEEKEALDQLQALWKTQDEVLKQIQKQDPQQTKKPGEAPHPLMENLLNEHSERNKNISYAPHTPAEIV